MRGTGYRYWVYVLGIGTGYRYTPCVHPMPTPPHVHTHAYTHTYTPHLHVRATHHSGLHMAGYTWHWRTLTEHVRAQLTEATCWYCNTAIDLSLHHDDAWSLTFDHVVPRVLGGTDTLDNMACAHRSCNTKRSNELKRKGLNIKTSRQW